MFLGPLKLKNGGVLKGTESIFLVRRDKKKTSIKFISLERDIFIHKLFTPSIVLLFCHLQCLYFSWYLLKGYIDIERKIREWEGRRFIIVIIWNLSRDIGEKGWLIYLMGIKGNQCLRNLAFQMFSLCVYIFQIFSIYKYFILRYFSIKIANIL